MDASSDASPTGLLVPPGGTAAAVIPDRRAASPTADQAPGPPAVDGAKGRDPSSSSEDDAAPAVLDRGLALQPAEACPARVPGGFTALPVPLLRLFQRSSSSSAAAAAACSIQRCRWQLQQRQQGAFLFAFLWPAVPPQPVL